LSSALDTGIIELGKPVFARQEWSGCFLQCIRDEDLMELLGVAREAYNTQFMQKAVIGN